MNTKSPVTQGVYVSGDSDRTTNQNDELNQMHDPPDANDNLAEQESIDHSLYDDELHSGAIDRQSPERSLLLARNAAETAIEEGGNNVVILDMTGHTAMFDYFVIATGTSRRQLHAMSEGIDHVLEDKLNDKRMNIDGYDESRWIVLDYGTVVVHLFDEETRAFYALEALWSDAPQLNI